MAITVADVVASPLPNGYVLVAGKGTFDSNYATGGETMDLSSYILSTATPIITFNGGDDGYSLEGDRGTAAANKVKLMRTNSNAAAATVLIQAAAATNAAAVIFHFMAIGPTP